MSFKEKNTKCFTDYKLVIFDVDGTLYHQPLLRILMLFNLVIYYSFHPLRIKELKILSTFRNMRESKEMLNSANIVNNQYEWCAQKFNLHVDNIKDIIELWIHVKPLKFLKFCRFNNLVNLLRTLAEKKIITCVYSDYIADAKLKALKLNFDKVYSSEQPEINALKPNPKGVLYILNQLEIPKEKVLFIGDRKEFDGQCAANAGIDSLIIKPFSANKVFKKLTNEFGDR